MIVNSAMAMSIRDKRSKIVEDWLSASSVDLQSAKILYANKIYPACLYHLQQSNEKLAKGLLLQIGFLTPKRSKEDLRIKSILGFRPKEPAEYRHTIMHSFLSDAEKSVPAIEEIFQLMNYSDFGPKILEFYGVIRKSGKGVEKLKKRPFGLIEKEDQLVKEIQGAQGILAAIDNVQKAMDIEIAKLNPTKTIGIATEIARKAGFDIEGIKPPSFEESAQRVESTLLRAILAVLSVAIASFLDPLESVTRYPDSQQSIFNENNPYILHFISISDLINNILERSRLFEPKNKE